MNRHSNTRLGTQLKFVGTVPAEVISFDGRDKTILSNHNFTHSGLREGKT